MAGNILHYPVNELLKINRTRGGKKQSIQIINFQGKLIYEDQDFQGEFIDVRQFKNGCYILKYISNEYYTVKKIIISH